MVTLLASFWGDGKSRKEQGSASFDEALMRHKLLSGRVRPAFPLDVEVGAGGGGRTHMTSRPLDFESSASANSATPALITNNLRMPNSTDPAFVYRLCTLQTRIASKKQGEYLHNLAICKGVFGAFLERLLRQQSRI